MASSTAAQPGKRDSWINLYRPIVREWGIITSMLAVIVCCVAALIWFRWEVSDSEKRGSEHIKSAITSHEDRRLERAHPDAISRMEIENVVNEIRAEVKAIADKQDTILTIIRKPRRRTP